MNIDPKSIYLSQLRDRNTQCAEFRIAAEQIARILALQAKDYLRAAHLPSCHQVTLIPILRSGIAMLPAFLDYFPDASIGMIGLKRNKKTGLTEQYYCNIPPLSQDHCVIILDPMIATGNTACAALNIVTQQIPIQRILFIGIMSAQEGIDAIKKTHPDAQLIVAAKEAGLDENNYIVPGLGDFGDRYFGTIE